MSFTSNTFIVYFIIFFIIYWLFKEKRHQQNIFLLISNFAFYAMMDLRFAGLLLLTILSVYYAAIYCDRISIEKRRKTILLLTIILNIGILFLFKYYNFFAYEFCRLFNLNTDKILLNLILPVGISFYTFTSLGYVIDVYRKKIPAIKDFLSISAFISFFPLLTSGPIERTNGLLPQFFYKRSFDYDLVCDGVQQIIYGFFKKLVIADNCASVVSVAFGNYDNLPGSSLFVGALLYTIQIYCDFSGYSDIAIGLSKMLGFRVRKNFNYPYFALNVSDFWKRWHMSLQSWFIDYIYIPLGGSRCSKVRIIFNTFIVFIISGIWHGSNWTFIAWGIYHAILFIPLILYCSRDFRRKTFSYDTKFPSIKELSYMLLTVMLITIGWIIFNSASITDAIGYISSMFDYSLFSIPRNIGLPSLFYISVLIVILFIIEWIMRSKEFALQFKASGWVKVLILYVLIIHIIFCKAAQADFIYFQF